MARKRGFFAEMQRQSQIAARQGEQQRRAAERAAATASREAERKRREAERTQMRLARDTATQQKAAEQRAKKAHEESMQREVADLNERLLEQNEEINSLLAWTLAFDDYVDLERLRKVAEHPTFPRPELERPVPAPAPLQAPLEPQYVEPVKPGGLKGMLAGKQYAEAVAAAQVEYHRQHEWWRRQVGELPAAQMRQLQEHQAAEQRRIAELDQARLEYHRECEQRESVVAEENGRLDALIAGLDAGEEPAVHEYLWLVLGNSLYPDSFPVDHDFEFDSALRELTLSVYVPPPTALPAVKEYKYVKARDEITETALAQKTCKDRYSSAVAQVALRTMHEVFEADRAGWVQTIALTVGTETTDPATGLGTKVPFIAVATDRSFAAFDLANVVPLVTLDHLGAQVSKNPFGLVPVDLSKGVRSK